MTNKHIVVEISMMKKIILSLGIITMFQCFANENPINYAHFSEKYWGLFIPRPDTHSTSDHKEYPAVVIYFQKNTLTIISAAKTYQTKYNIEEGVIKYHKKNGKHLIDRRIFYNQKDNTLYYKKPGFWYFIPKKIIYHPLRDETAQKAIEELRKNEFHKFEL